MANYLATDTDLTAVANAIRTKGGTSASLAFPSDFVSAINAISGGGGTPDFGWTNETEITIGANSVATTQDAVDYFSSYSGKVLAICEDAATVNNQVLGIQFGPNRAIRIQNGNIGTAVNVASNYSGALVEGTKYLLLTL